MSDISRAIASLQEDFDSADALVEEIYQKYFARYFAGESELYAKFQDSEIVINDKELEWILITLPLNLKSVSSALAQFKQHNEIVKLKIKQRKSKDNDSEPGLDEEYKLMSIIYAAVITRVEAEISFSKELIMGAKKVWDARRSSEIAPVREIVPDQELPEYRIDDPNKVDF